MPHTDDSGTDGWKFLPEYKSWQLEIGRAIILLQPRPSYCDRGRWMAWTAQVAGIVTIDSGDSFPRYYMNLERAKLELQEWLAFRVLQDRRHINLHPCPHCGNGQFFSWVTNHCFEVQFRGAERPIELKTPLTMRRCVGCNHAYESPEAKSQRNEAVLDLFFEYLANQQ